MMKETISIKMQNFLHLFYPMKSHRKHQIILNIGNKISFKMNIYDFLTLETFSKSSLVDKGL